jgi:MFS family permease
VKNMQSNQKLYQLFTADALSEIGDVFYYVALITYASQLANSSLAISLVTTLEFIPPVFSIIIGPLADKLRNKTKVSMSVNIIQCVLYIINGLLFFKFQKWMLFSLCLIINFISDTLGIITQEMEPIILKKLSPKISYERKYGWLSAIAQSFSIGGKFLGGILLTLLNNHYIFMSFINAATFGCAAVALALIGNIIVQDEIHENKEDKKSGALEGVKFLKNNPKVRFIVILLSNINIVLAPILPIAYILLANKEIYTPVNYSMSVSLLTAIDSLASILGPTFGLRLFKGKKALINSVMVGSIFSLTFCLSIFTRNIYVLMLTLFLASFFIGATIPLLFGGVIKNVPEAKIGSVNGVIDTLLAITPPLSTFIFSSSVQYVSAFVNILILSIFSGLIILIIIRNKKNLF